MPIALRLWMMVALFNVLSYETASSNSHGTVKCLIDFSVEGELCIGAIQYCCDCINKLPA